MAAGALLVKRADGVSAVAAGSHVLLVLFPVWLAAAGAPGFHWVFLWLWFGLTMSGLLNLMHECAHYHTFQRRWACDLLGRWVLGPLALADFEGYRHRHWKHHTRFGQPDDTKDAYLISIRGWNLALFFLRSLLAVEALRKFRQQTGGKQEGLSQGSAATLLRIGMAQGIFLGSLFLSAWAFHPDLSQAVFSSLAAYIGVYGYGLASLTVLAANMRAIAEHQIGADDAPATGRAALRNFSCNHLTRLVLGAYGFGEHATHHLQPGIPYYHLRRATAEAAAGDRSLRPGPGYVATLTMMIRRPRGLASPAASRGAG